MGKKIISICCLSVFVIVPLLHRQTGSSASSQSISGIEARPDAYVRPYLDIGGFDGTILLTKGDKVLSSKGYGMANYELNVRNSSRTKFNIASISKTLTAAEIMILQEGELLSVTDPLTKSIPHYPDGQKITVHHLLTDNSGIANINSFPEYDDWSKFPCAPKVLIEKFKNKPPDSQPGECRYAESNGNYNKLAFIGEKLSDESSGDLLSEKISGPLGVEDDSHDANPENIIANRPNGYLPIGIDDLKKMAIDTVGGMSCVGR